MSYEDQRIFADKFLDEQKKILDKYKSRLDFDKSDDKYSFKYDLQKDLKENTDLLIYEYSSLRIALRVRNTSKCMYRDITIRSYSNGYKTEYDKLMDGHGDYMLYCWGSLQNNIAIIEEYMLLDLKIFKEKNDNFIKVKDKCNGDSKTKFNIYDCKKIVITDCCIVNHMPSLFESNKYSVAI